MDFCVAPNTDALPSGHAISRALRSRATYSCLSGQSVVRFTWAQGMVLAIFQLLWHVDQAAIRALHLPMEIDSQTLLLVVSLALWIIFASVS